MSNRPGYELALQATVISISVLVALIIGEIMLRVYAGSVSQGEHMEPGLIRYHSRYGWRLSPSWQGRHQHVDYDVEYKIDHLGFRAPVAGQVADKGAGKDAEKPLALVVGDSFTFGLGVDNGHTYVDQLNTLQDEYRFVNAAVPGYAPEQTLLVAESLTQAMQPELLVFTVYLGNDLIDLGLPYPIQADQGKPVATLNSGSFQIENIPVPKSLKPEPMRQKSLASEILVPGTSGGVLSGLKLVQLLSESGLVAASGELDIDAIEHSLDLFEGVLDRLVLAGNETRVVVVLIPGASAANRLDSLSGRYQSMLADQIGRLCKERELELVDLLSDQDFRDQATYFPNDGHLTSDGHRVVATQLSSVLAGSGR